MWCIRPLLVAIVLLSPATVRAQLTAPPNQWARGTELAVLVGGATSASTSGPIVAATAGWEVTRWFAVEGRGSWFDRGADASAFGADLNALFNVIAKRTVTPFVGAGFGLYRATFNNAAAPMPEFYRMRMASRAGTTAFTDPALRVTAGVDFLARRNWTLRPEISALVVRSDGHGESVVSAGVSIGYRFEEHLITPSR
jgi:hypothetical protein